MKPLPQSALVELQQREDFKCVFGEPGNYSGSCDPLGFTRADIAELYLVAQGDNDGPDWVAVGRLNDDRYFLASGGCDTGWDWQSSNSGQV